MGTGLPDDLSRILLTELSHSLQTPLAVLKGRVARLRAGTVHEGTQPDLDSIDACVEQLSKIIADALCLDPLSFQERVELSQLVEEAVQDAEAISEPYGIRVVSTVEPSLTLHGGNVRCLREAVANLLANAVKYIGNEPLKEIGVDLYARQSEAILTIADTGIGIPERDLPHIFNRFYRSTRVYGIAPGMGIGLAFVQRVVESHGGSITVKSAVGTGTTFTLTFPLDRHGQDAREGIGGDDDVVDKVDTEQASGIGDLARNDNVRPARRRAP